MNALKFYEIKVPVLFLMANLKLFISTFFAVIKKITTYFALNH